MPWGGAEGQNVYRSNLGTFNARKLKFGMLLTPRPNLQLCNKVAPGSCLGVELGVKIYNMSDFTLTFTSSFLLDVKTWRLFYVKKLKFGLLFTQT